MTRRDQKRLLIAIHLALAAGLAGTIVWAVAPLGQPEQTAPVRVLRAASAPSPWERVAPLEHYAAVYRGNLRRPLFDAPPVQPTSVPVALPAIRLVGTMIAPDSRSGIFRTSANESRLAAVGETIDGAEVLDITATSARLRFAGQTFTLQKEGASP